MLLNPDLEFPFQIELDLLVPKDSESLKNEVARRLREKKLTTWSTKYGKFQSTVWWELKKTVQQCTSFCPRNRAKVLNIVQLFKEIKIAKSTARDIQLSVNQTTAVECHDKPVAAGATPLNVQIPSDATNSCAFLSVLITDLFVGNHGKVPVLNNVLAK